MQAYSMDLRERALLDSDAGMKAADVAVKYRVSGSWVRLLKQRRRETGEIAPRVQRHGRRRMLEPHLHTLAALIAEQPDRTLAELKDALGTPASLATIWRAVAALDVTVKKKRSGPLNTIDLTFAWHAEAPAWDPTRLVFLDETGITNNLLRRYGRALRGARVHDRAPCARGQTSTFLAALRVTGLTAPGVFDGAIDGASFLAYIEQILVPTLAPGDIVIATTSPRTKSRVSAPRSSASAPCSAICRPTVRTSIPLSSASRSSKPSCGPPAVDPTRPSGPSSAPVCRTSAPTNVVITFDTAATRAPHGHEKRFSLPPRHFTPGKARTDSNENWKTDQGRARRHHDGSSEHPLERRAATGQRAGSRACSRGWPDEPSKLSQPGQSGWTRGSRSSRSHPHQRGW